MSKCILFLQFVPCRNCLLHYLIMHFVTFMITLWSLIICKLQFKIATRQNLLIFRYRVGGWSTEGLTVDRNNSNRTSVICVTTHLTSFAVLVSIQDDKPVSIINYYDTCDEKFIMKLFTPFLAIFVYIRIRSLSNLLKI